MPGEDCWRPPTSFKSIEEFKNYAKHYLHKRDIDLIFDLTRWTYCSAGPVKSWEFDGKILSIESITNDDFPPLRMRISFPNENTVSICVNQNPSIEPLPVSLEKIDGSLNLESRRYIARISFNNSRIGFLDQDGRILLEEYEEGIGRTFFPVFPLSYKKAGNSLHLVESYRLEPDEAIYGFGETFTLLDKRGQKFLCWNTDTTYTGGMRSYKCIPFYLSTRNYGLFVNFGGKILFEVGSEYSSTSISFEAWSDKVEYFLIFGRSLKDIISTYMGITGKPQVPPVWSFGFWQSRAGYRNREEVMKVAHEIRRRKIPCDVIHIDPFWLKRGHYCDLEWDEEAFPDPRGMIKELSDMGFKVSLWIQPYVPLGTKLYEEAARAGYFLKDADGKIIHIIDFVRNSCSIIDFSNPQAREWYKTKLKKIMEEGVRVFKTDMGEAVPEEAVFSDGRTGLEAHNAYALLYLSTVYEATKEFYGEGLVWGRPGFAGIQSYPAQWAGDCLANYGEMAATLWGVLSYSLSGVPFWSHDIGGFQGNKPSPNLYIRWSQWGLLSPLSRAHGTTPREPWEYGQKALKIFRRFDELRYSLIPYLYSLAKQSCDELLPIVRPLVLEFQNDRTTWRLANQYMIGSEILVVPILNESGEVTYYLPEGHWVDLWKPVRQSYGRTWVRERVPISRIPIWVRENSIIPMTKPMRFVHEKSINEMTLMIYPKDRGSFRYFFDGEEFQILFKRGSRKISICLGPTRKKWNIKLLGLKRPKRIGGINWEYKHGVLLLKGITALHRKIVSVMI